MKISKRIISIIICLTVCIVGLPFSMHAIGLEPLPSPISPMGIHCSCINPTYTVVSTSNPTYQIIQGTYYGCYIQYYETVTMQCDHCHIIFHQSNVGIEKTHESYSLVMINGQSELQCSKCGYIVT